MTLSSQDASAIIRGVTAVLEEENLQLRVDDEADIPKINTGFINLAITIAIDHDYLAVEAAWRGSVVTDDAATLLAVTNEWNQSQISPQVRFFERDGQLNISMMRQVLISEGITYNQCGAFLMSTLESMVAASQWLEENFPESITWNDPHAVSHSSESKDLED